MPAVRVPEIEPPVVRKAWREYRRQKLEYLAESEQLGSRKGHEGGVPDQ
jgi:hypothetical protein